MVYILLQGGSLYLTFWLFEWKSLCSQILGYFFEFSKEFKREAAGLILDQGYSVPEACKAMDVGSTVINRWVQQLQSERSGVIPKAKALTPEHQRIQELEAQV